MCPLPSTTTLHTYFEGLLKGAGARFPAVPVCAGYGHRAGEGGRQSLAGPLFTAAVAALLSGEVCGEVHEECLPAALQPACPG